MVTERSEQPSPWPINDSIGLKHGLHFYKLHMTV